MPAAYQLSYTHFFTSDKIMIYFLMTKTKVRMGGKKKSFSQSHILEGCHRWKVGSDWSQNIDTEISCHCEFATMTFLVSALMFLVVSVYLVNIFVMFLINDHLNRSRFRIQAHIWYWRHNIVSLISKSVVLKWLWNHEDPSYQPVIYFSSSDEHVRCQFG